jgi:hypothetical protein
MYDHVIVAVLTAQPSAVVATSSGDVASPLRQTLRIVTHEDSDTSLVKLK